LRNLWGEVICEVYDANGALMDVDGMSMYLGQDHTEKFLCDVWAIGRPNTYHVYGRVDVDVPMPWE
jgi:hypothetical protein